MCRAAQDVHTWLLFTVILSQIIATHLKTMKIDYLSDLHKAKTLQINVATL